MQDEIQRHARTGESFAFETTLSGRGYVRWIKRWRADGYHVKLIFLSLNNPEQAIARVALPVSQGGHAVPEEIVRRRFQAGLANFRQHYGAGVDAWVLYDNSDSRFAMLEWSDPE